MKKLELAIINFIQKAKSTNQVGANLNQMQLDEIAKSMKMKLPKWYEKLMCESSIINIKFEYQEYEDYKSHISIANFKTIMNEINEAYPGVAIKELGYVNFGTCLEGSGDPIFINLKEESNPFVVRVYHDGLFFENGKIDEDSGKILANKLSVFFEKTEFLNY